MLQQTTVKTVENKILEIINIFPSFNSFKNKRLEHLLKVWSGLGYYKRAENLFKAVQLLTIAIMVNCQMIEKVSSLCLVLENILQARY